MILKSQQNRIELVAKPVAVVVGCPSGAGAATVTVGSAFQLEWLDSGVTAAAAVGASHRKDYYRRAWPD